MSIKSLMLEYFNLRLILKGTNHSYSYKEIQTVMRVTKNSCDQSYLIVCTCINTTEEAYYSKI